MPFGISPAPEELQHRLDTAVAGLRGVVPIFDGTLIFGVGGTKAEAVENHDQRLAALLERCRNKSIKLNEEKCKFRLSEVSFIGHVISDEGLDPDPAKIQGVQEMPTPQNKQDVKRLLGMVNYLQKFALNLSETTAPMRELLKQKNQFLWDEEVQGRSFKPRPNDRNIQRNISQHCWAQHVARVWPPCCDMLQHVACCWLKFENGQIFHATFVDVA